MTLKEFIERDSPVDLGNGIKYVYDGKVDKPMHIGIKIAAFSVIEGKTYRHNLIVNPLMIMTWSPKSFEEYMRITIQKASDEIKGKLKGK